MGYMDIEEKLDVVIELFKKWAFVWMLLSTLQTFFLGIIAIAMIQLAVGR